MRAVDQRSIITIRAGLGLRKSGFAAAPMKWVKRCSQFLREHIGHCPVRRHRHGRTDPRRRSLSIDRGDADAGENAPPLVEVRGVLVLLTDRVEVAHWLGRKWRVMSGYCRPKAALRRDYKTSRGLLTTQRRPTPASTVPCVAARAQAPPLRPAIRSTANGSTFVG